MAAFVMKKDGGSVVVDLLLHVPPVVCGGFVLSLFWYALLCVLYSFAIILMRKRERESWLPCFNCLLVSCYC